METIKTELFKNVPGEVANFILSSPTNGIASEEQNYLAENPNDSLYGDSK